MAFSIAHLPHANEDYTVIRSGGDEETGWKVVQESHAAGEGPMAGREKTGKPFRVLMENGGKNLWAWRRVETIWPTRLTVDEIADWQKKFLICLEENDLERMNAAIQAARYNGTPDMALEAEYDAALDAQVAEDMKLPNPPFRSSNFTSVAEAEEANRAGRAKQEIQGFESH